MAQRFSARSVLRTFLPADHRATGPSCARPVGTVGSRRERVASVRTLRWRESRRSGGAGVAALRWRGSRGAPVPWESRRSGPVGVAALRSRGSRGAPEAGVAALRRRGSRDAPEARESRRRRGEKNQTREKPLGFALRHAHERPTRGGMKTGLTGQPGVQRGRGRVTCCADREGANVHRADPWRSARKRSAEH